MEAAQEGADVQKLADVIGQFGVGFYSVFMVAEWVRVTSRSYKPDADPATWYATGEDTFTVASAEKEDRGTTIEIKLNEEAEEFASESRLRQTIKKHSDYVRYPIYLSDEKEQINRQTAIWRQSPGEIEDEEYTQFYNHLTMEMEDPLTHIHFIADAPLRIFALLYLPAKPERSMFSLRKEDGLKLYARKVLIEEYNTDLLPPYYRFMQGVVDSEDLPLNVSRESVQATAMIARIKKILTNQVTKELERLAAEEPETYAAFWRNFGPFIKEGIASDQFGRENLYPLVRFHTTTHPQTWTSLDEYIERMKDGQEKIYYILGDDPGSVARSPHLDYFRKHGYEVITWTDPMDSFMLMGLREYADFELQNVADPDLELPVGAQEPEEDTAPEPLPDDEIASLVDRFKEQLGERVTDVRTTDRLTDSVARLVDPEGTLNQEMQRVYRLMDRDYEVPKKVLELNPRHPVLAKLNQMPIEDGLSTLVIEQIYDSALLIEGLHPDPASMLPRIQDLMEKALE
jgi:molecular chaperone HtpG